jgi:hypothetical protein
MTFPLFFFALDHKRSCFAKSFFLEKLPSWFSQEAVFKVGVEGEADLLRISTKQALIL